MTAADPIRRSVTVACAPDDAFHLFTTRLAEWWPLDTHSVGGVEAVDVSLDPWVGGTVAERLDSGATHTWGTVVEWDPPRRLAMTWHPGRPATEQTHVAVEFETAGDGTVVTLVHSGWDRRRDGVAARHAYADGWVLVLGRLESAVTASS